MSLAVAFGNRTVDHCARDRTAVSALGADPPVTHAQHIGSTQRNVSWTAETQDEWTLSCVVCPQNFIAVV